MATKPRRPHKVLNTKILAPATPQLLARTAVVEELSYPLIALQLLAQLLLQPLAQQVVLLAY